MIFTTHHLDKKKAEEITLPLRQTIERIGSLMEDVIQKEIKARIGRGPNLLDPEFKAIMEQMYQALAYRITGSELLAEGMSIEKVVSYLKKM